MIYTQELTIPPKTQPYNPVRAVLNPTVRNVRQVSVLFPNGCLSAVGVRLYDGGIQFLPQSGWLTDNNKELNFNPNRKLQGSPFQIVFEGYNLAVDWPHKITFRMDIIQ